MSIISNQNRGYVTFHFIANSGAIIVAGNNSVSNIALATENIGGATIRKVIFSSNGSWTITRGANTVAVLHGNHVIDFAGMGMGLNLDPAANIAFTHSASATGFIICEIAKIQVANSAYTAPY
jgi:hypothetical protein